MKSNKCLFSKTVFKSNILRFLPFAAPLLIAELIAFPLALYSSAGKITLNIFANASLASDIISMLFAGLFGILVFSYLFKPNTCNAFHAFPVGRKALFVTGLISAYTLLVIPQLIGLAAGIPILLNTGVAPAQCITLGIASIFGVSFVALSTAVLAVMLAGNIFSSVVLYVIINFIYVVAESLFETAVSGFGAGISTVSTASQNAYLSPFSSLVLSKASLGGEAAGAVLTEQAISIDDYYKLLIIFVVAAVVIFALAYLLYKIRKLETAGDMVSFKAEIPILSIIGAVFGSAFFTALLSAIFSFKKQPVIVSYIVFSLICYFAAQMIIRKKAKVFSAKNFAVWALTAIITIGIVLGCALYETNLVPSKNIKSVKVESTYAFEADREEYTTVADLHRALIKNELKGDSPVQLLLGTGENNSFGSDSTEISPADVGVTPSYTVNLTYTLTNGRTVGRVYTVLYGTKEIDALVDKLEENHSAKTVFDRMDEISYTLKSCSIQDYTSETEDGSYNVISLDTQDTKKMYELCKADLDARKVNVHSTKRDEEDGITDGSYISFTFTVNNPDDYNRLNDEPYLSDFSSATIDIYSFTDNEPKDLSKKELTLNVGTLTKGGDAEKFMLEKLKNK